jgi:flavin reductase (DIM6/NTAB) family NADH-FMN oxidoreductase RutF
VSKFDQKEFRNLMGNFCSGIVVVTAVDDQGPVGFTAQSFVSLSLEPPLVAVCPANTSTSWPRIRDSKKFCINILSSEQQNLSNNFASSADEKFTGIEWTKAHNGAPILNGNLAHIECSLYDELPAGDHTIAIGEVSDFSVNPDAPETPLLYFKGKYLDL